MFSFGFWQKWLLAVSVYLVLFGLTLALFPQACFMDTAFNSNIDPVFWKDGAIPSQTKIFQAWIYGVLGAVVMGWGLLMAFVTYYPFRSQEKWAWNAMAIGICAWFVVDTGLSAYHQAYFNIFNNTVTLILIGLPLIFTRRHFA